MRHRSEAGFAFLTVLLCYALLAAARLAARGRLPSEYLLTVPVQLLLGCGLLVCLRRRGRLAHYGLKPVRGTNPEKLLYYLPLVLLCVPNLLGAGAGERALLPVLGLFLGAFFEELFFRGFLVRLLQGRSEGLAIAASALPFGAAHLLNLPSGESAAYTLWQVVAAAAFGFMAAVLFLKTGSILPSILCHGGMNAAAALFPPASPAGSALAALAITLIGTGYGWYLLRLPSTAPPGETERE